MPAKAFILSPFNDTHEIVDDNEMAKSGSQRSRGQLRIIGGSWRGRKLHFTPMEGLRPTADRTRETLFNWLAPTIGNARCLDLFAGSGALGLEALSRGARYCDFVDRAPTCTGQISQHLASLDASGRAGVHATEAARFLATASEPYDVVFLDPPFEKQLLQPACTALAESGLLSTGALVYIEMGANEVAPEMPQEWQLHRQKAAGGVSYQLYTLPQVQA